MSSFSQQQPLARFLGPADKVILVLGSSGSGNALVIQDNDGNNVAAISQTGDIKTLVGVFNADETSIESIPES